MRGKNYGILRRKRWNYKKWWYEKGLGGKTDVGGEGSSVFDLVIEIENETSSMIIELVVETRIESDHHPVEIYIGRKENSKGNKEKTIKDYWLR